jgi:hypothetical protein
MIRYIEENGYYKKSLKAQEHNKICSIIKLKTD